MTHATPASACDRASSDDCVTPTAAQILADARALHRAGRPEAAARYREALDRDPMLHAAWDGLGMIAHAHRRWKAAVEAFERASALAPRHAVYRVHLGAALTQDGRAAEAIGILETALALEPSSIAAWVGLGNACQQAGDADRAIVALQKAIALDPGLPAAHNNLGNLLKEVGRLDEALVAYRSALAADPGSRIAATNLLVAQKLRVDSSPLEILEVHRAWTRTLERELAPRPPVRAGTDRMDRPLRLGYLSPDAHVALPAFVRGVFAHHDRDRFILHAYYNNPQGRETVPGVAHRVLAGLDDAQVAALVAADDLDLLVDLAGHTGSNRLAIFARRPARVTFTWLDYVSTTGMASIDFRITDAVADPPGEAEPAHSERLMRLPVPAWCWIPPGRAPDAGPLPLASTGVPTFGSFNHAMKLTDATLATWRRLFEAIRTARLLVVGVPPGSARNRVVDALAIAPARIEFLPRLDAAGYRATFARVDVALDTMPFSGATTTLDALWQGVPVVTLPGPWTWSRSTASLLTGLGARDWIARDATHYVEIAQGLVADVAGLASIRAGLRERVAAAPMTDVAGFVRCLEKAYRDGWACFLSGELHRQDTTRS